MDTTVIIGGGFAGITAAYELAKIGKKSLILEKNPYLGGNVHSFYYNDKGYDMGVMELFEWYFHLRKLLDEIGMGEIFSPKNEVILGSIYYDQDRGIFGYPTPLATPSLLKIFTKVLPRVSASHTYWLHKDKSLRLPNENLGEFFDELYAPDSVAHDVVCASVEGATYGNPYEINLGVALLPILETVYSHPTTYTNCDIRKIIDRIMRLFPIDFRVSVDIRHIDYKNKIITYTNDGKRFMQEYTNLIFACPINHFHKELLGVSCKYTKFYSILVKIDRMVTNNLIFFKPKHKDPEIKSAQHMRCSDAPTMIFYVESSRRLPDAEIWDFLVKECQKIDKIEFKLISPIYIKYFENTMPMIDHSTLNTIIDNQGKNDIYFCGQYLGVPSLEIAYYSAKWVAGAIAGDTSQIEQESIELENTSKFMVYSPWILFLVSLVLICILLGSLRSTYQSAKIESYFI